MNIRGIYTIEIEEKWRRNESNTRLSNNNHEHTYLREDVRGFEIVKSGPKCKVMAN
jgi:hypothetical protein